MRKALEPHLSPCETFFWRSLPLRQRTGSAIFAALFQPQTQQAEADSSESSAIATLLESPYPLPPDSLPEQASEMARYSICAGPPRVVAGTAQLWTPAIGQVLPLLAQMAQQMPPKPVFLAAKLADDSTAVSSASSPVVEDPSTATSSNAQALEQLPFVGGWLGWLGYDCAWEIERLPWLKEDALPFPVAFWYEPAEFAVLDHQQQRLWLAAETAVRLDDLLSRLNAFLRVAVREAVSIGEDATGGDATGSDISKKVSVDTSIYIDKYSNSDKYPKPQNTSSLLTRTAAIPDESEPSARGRTYGLRFETDQSEFEQAVIKAKAHIRAGDVFQVNHSLRFQAQTTLSSWQVYRTLHRINPSPFASYWHTPWGAVVSCSPERLVQLNAGVAQSRPIAGTRPRGKTREIDDAIAQNLKGDRKECAEHIMLVDLARNDLGRVCKWGSVQVAELMSIERYSHVMHLVSNVTGQLDTDGQNADARDLIAALFPGGTITGCPKVRCMEIIEAIEPVRRSLFYGSCGYFDRRGRLDLNILIRTLLLSSSEDAEKIVWGQVGAGIVADSDPEREWQESLQKAKAQLLALGL